MKILYDGVIGVVTPKNSESSSETKDSAGENPANIALQCNDEEQKC